MVIATWMSIYRILDPQKYESVQINVRNITYVIENHVIPSFIIFNR